MNLSQTVELLKEIIRIPSFSGQEESVRDLFLEKISAFDVKAEVLGNNIIARHSHFDPAKPTIMLNSHMDTVKPKGNWDSDPFNPVEDGDRITGLGSNDAGASLVSLVATFLHFQKIKLPFNLLFVASAEEESSGLNGMPLVVENISNIDFAIVGEPTQMQIASAEKGLMVLECTARGKAGHAARDEGINALYLAMEDIAWIKNHRFEKISPTLGEVKMTVTAIKAGEQHNVVPAECWFLVDIRSTDVCGNEEILKTLKSNLKSEIFARSTRLRPSGIPDNHPILRIAENLHLTCYGSPTLSDQAVMPWNSVKIGPGDSARSHTANEYILKSEIEQGLALYKRIIEGLAHETLG